LIVDGAPRPLFRRICAGLDAAMEDADQSVAELAKRSAVAGAAGV
jgi:hypothetical protein